VYLDNFASKFANVGFVVTVFDYRFFGGSEAEPRPRRLWPEQIRLSQCDYLTMTQKEVDPARIGVWGTSYSGGHAIFLGAYDRRIKAVVAQVPVTDVWDTYMAKWPEEAARGFSHLAGAEPGRRSSHRQAQLHRSRGAGGSALGVADAGVVRGVHGAIQAGSVVAQQDGHQRRIHT
jgi:hypothetical protein